MSCRYEIKTIQNETVAVVAGVAHPAAAEVVAAAYRGVPVRRIASRAFAGSKTLKEIVLPDTVQTLEGFVFHNCKSLKKLTLSDSITEYGDGVIRACTALHDIDLALTNGNFALMARLLADSDYTLTFHLTFADGEKALLTFPGFVYDFTENTMARTIQFNIEGSGMAFRECVARTGIDFAAYDRLFERALLDEISIITDIALGRLMYPYGLSDRAEHAYKTYLRRHAAHILSGLIAKRDIDKIRFFAAEDLIPDEALTVITGDLSNADAQITALLMERSSKGKPTAGAMTL